METNATFFSNKDITVTFEPCICIHAERCARELSEVFRNSVIPWIDLDGASTKQIIEQVKKCPSKALKFYRNKEQEVA
ncbi:(4Fe-4S)-binding protein [Flavobacteriaceae bacterium LMO-SS05]